MPIEPSVKIERISEQEFYAIDHEIMGAVFTIHNEMGRFYDEKIYQNEIAYRCQEMDLGEVLTEVPIRVSYRNFMKFYYVDLLVDGQIMYELKTVDSLLGQHRKQALNYLLLMGMGHGKLVNMRSSSVKHHFVSTRLTPEKRYDFTVNDDEWNDLDKDSIWLKHLMVDLLSEWGAFLDTNLFYDAISHFRGGIENNVGRVDVIKDSRLLGSQSTPILNNEVAFKLSSVTKSIQSYERHLRHFLNHTSLKAMQWINFNHHQIVFKTLSK